MARQVGSNLGLVGNQAREHCLLVRSSGFLYPCGCKLRSEGTQCPCYCTISIVPPIGSHTANCPFKSCAWPFMLHRHPTHASVSALPCRTIANKVANDFRVLRMHVSRSVHNSVICRYWPGRSAPRCIKPWRLTTDWHHDRNGCCCRCCRWL